MATFSAHHEACQAKLAAAIQPAAGRRLKRYKALPQARAAAKEGGDGKGAGEAKDELQAPVLFKGDLVTFKRLNAFLSQIASATLCRTSSRPISRRSSRRSTGCSRGSSPMATSWSTSTACSRASQALGSERVRSGLKDILLGPAQLYEALRAKGEGVRPSG